MSTGRRSADRPRFGPGSCTVCTMSAVIQTISSDSLPAAVRTVGSGSSPADIAKVLDEDGCVVISDLAPPKTRDQIGAELGAYLAAPDGGNPASRGKPPRRTGALIARS